MGRRLVARQTLLSSESLNKTDGRADRYSTDFPSIPQHFECYYASQQSTF